VTDNTIEPTAEEPTGEELLTIREVANMAGVRYQQVYNYTDLGMIPFEYDASRQGQRCIKRDAAEAWVATYTSRKIEREQKRKAKIEAELRGERP
jgi:hypothetical protein